LATTGIVHLRGITVGHAEGRELARVWTVVRLAHPTGCEENCGVLGEIVGTSTGAITTSATAVAHGGTAGTGGPALRKLRPCRIDGNSA
jgi:hypothetical protein